MKHNDSDAVKTNSSSSHVDLSDETLKILILETKQAIYDNKCYPLEIRETIFKSNVEVNDNLLKEIQKIYKQLSCSSNAEHFYSSYFSTIVIFAELYFVNLQKPMSTLLATKLADKILFHFKKPQEVAITTPLPITEKEMGGLKYLSGYVIRKFLKQAKNSKHYTSIENQAIITILQNGITTEHTNHRLINAQSRGGLTAVTDEVIQIFLRAEQMFRVKAHILSSKIDINAITTSLMKDTEVVSFYNCIVQNSGCATIPEEVKDNLLENMLKLYFRVRAFSFARDISNKHKVA